MTLLSCCSPLNAGASSAQYAGVTVNVPRQAGESRISLTLPNMRPSYVPKPVSCSLQTSSSVSEGYDSVFFGGISVLVPLDPCSVGETRFLAILQ